jgi:hypothetical protein
LKLLRSNAAADALTRRFKLNSRVQPKFDMYAQFLKIIALMHDDVQSSG